MRPIVRAGLVLSLLAAPIAGFACGSSSGGGPSGAATGPTSTGTGAVSGSTGTTDPTGGSGGAGGTGVTGTGTNSGGATGVGGAATGSGNTSGAGGAVIAECQGHVYQCGDTIDNDGDGETDSNDPDCLGPCDNTEDSYYGGIPGQSGPACLVDCYFDQDSGSGNDDCYWNHKCDEHEVAPGYHPESENGAQCAYNPDANTPGTGASCDELYATQSQDCFDYCGPLTPNGCDCFGCCELPAGGGQYVWLGSETNGVGTCTLADVANPSKCEPCKPVAACLNECGTCEICIGKDELPPECNPDGGGTSGSTGTGSTSTGTGGGGGGQCADGVQPCGQPGQGPCPSDYYCITGCCIKQPS